MESSRKNELLQGISTIATQKKDLLKTCRKTLDFNQGI
jgi:hypothetical protein